MKEKYYTTVGNVYDYIKEKCQNYGGAVSFPQTLEDLRAAGRLSTRPPAFPTFHSEADAGELWEFIRGLPVSADAILPQAHTYLSNPVIEECVLFPEEKDVFTILNMPYMVDVLHSHDFFEITYVLEGSCTFLFEGESATLNRGDLCIVSPGSGHSLPLLPGCISVAVEVRKSTFNRMFGDLLTKKDLLSLFFRNSLYEHRSANYILLKTGNDPMVLEALRQLVYESNLEDDNANTCAVCLLNLFLARALRAAKSEVTLHHYDGYSEQDFNFTLVLHHIQKNYRTVTLSSLAEAFHFSETYLSKLIRRQMNQNFTELLRTLKMDHAMEYLMNTAMKISEIAEAVGYDSVDHFSRTFRKVYGMSPQEYRKKERETKPTEDGEEAWIRV